MKKYIWAHEEYAITPLTISPNHNAWATPFLVKLLDGLKVGEKTFCVHKNFGLTFFINKDAWDKGSDYLISKIQKSPEFVKEVKDKSELYARKLLKIIRLTEKQDLKEWNNLKLADFLIKTYELSNTLCVWGYVPVFSDHLFNKYSNLLKKIIKESDNRKRLKLSIPETVNLLFSSLKAIPSRQSRIELLKIAYRLKGKILTKKDKNKIINYYQKWFWTGFGHLGPRITQKETIKSIFELSQQKSKVKQERKELQNHATMLAKKQAELFKKLNLDALEKYLFKVAQLFVYLKGLRMEILFGVYACWERILTEMSFRLKIPKKLLYYCSIAELTLWLNQGKAPSLKRLKDRSKFCVWVAISKNSQQILTGQKARQYLKEHVLKGKQKEGGRISDILVIHGTVASTGYAKGMVKIVNKTSEINKVKKGDILVSIATNPSLLPAMEKAKGFVTDVGGLTSHAAIVAREL